ncbi:hypothetical protein KKG22_05255 [Patescibacteria group bacterium]|nr:hypothetical protein [Patescibacteria group bacterium]MBU1721570.1 hypothetical protein [Patescibacteria group bacterium]MBU1901796.1 hypothetical protein [Patescibacteria group bacterium]
MFEGLHRYIRLAQRTGDRLILVDSQTGDDIVLMTVDQYEEVVEAGCSYDQYDECCYKDDCDECWEDDVSFDDNTFVDEMTEDASSNYFTDRTMPDQVPSHVFFDQYGDDSLQWDDESEEDFLAVPEDVFFKEEQDDVFVSTEETAVLIEEAQTSKEEVPVSVQVEALPQAEEEAIDSVDELQYEIPVEPFVEQVARLSIPLQKNIQKDTYESFHEQSNIPSSFGPIEPLIEDDPVFLEEPI